MLMIVKHVCVCRCVCGCAGVCARACVCIIISLVIHHSNALIVLNRLPVIILLHTNNSFIGIILQGKVTPWYMFE